MAQDAEAVVEAALALAPDERAVVAHRLLASLRPRDDAERADIDAAWRDEVGRRLDEVLNGTAKLIDGAEPHARIRAALGAVGGDDGAPVTALT